MKRRTFLTLSAGTAAFGLCRSIARAQGVVSGVMSPVLTRAYDNSRSGTTLNETILTQDNVGTKGIRKYFSLYMEGDARGAESQTLILPKVPVADGTVRDVAIVSSMNNLVWAYDANDSDILWVQKLGVPINGSSAIDFHSINDHWGILSTGVIDPDTYHWYGVVWSSPDGDPKKGQHSIHILNLKDGSQVRPPIPLADQEYAPGNGLPVQKYASTMRKQRSSLLMTKINGVKTIFFASGSVLETAKGSAGWIFAYDVASARISSCLAMSGGYGAGIWMAGSGPLRRRGRLPLRHDRQRQLRWRLGLGRDRLQAEIHAAIQREKSIARRRRLVDALHRRWPHRRKSDAVRAACLQGQRARAESIRSERSLRRACSHAR